MNITQETEEYFSTAEKKLYDIMVKRMLEGIKNNIDPDKSYLPKEFVILTLD